MSSLTPEQIARATRGADRAALLHEACAPQMSEAQRHAIRRETAGRCREALQAILSDAPTWELLRWAGSILLWEAANVGEEMSHRLRATGLRVDAWAAAAESFDCDPDGRTSMTRSWAETAARKHAADTLDLLNEWCQPSPVHRLEAEPTGPPTGKDGA